MRIQIIQMPFVGERNAESASSAPEELDAPALRKALNQLGAETPPAAIVNLTGDERASYGEWQRVALANAHLARLVGQALEDRALPVGLLANCNALMGMLAGMQSRDHAVGLIWIDAHADFNTPETTLSGMLGGMPVAISAGLCLHRIRETSGMTRPLSPQQIIMSGLRDVDPLERQLLDEHAIEEVPVETLPEAARRLGDVCDGVYVHVDMDVLDPDEVIGHPLTVAGGPSSSVLADVLREVFAADVVRALGVASTPPLERDRDGSAHAAAHRIIVGAAESAMTSRFAAR